MIWSHFLHQCVDTAQGKKTFAKCHRNLSRSRYSKEQKGQENWNVIWEKLWVQFYYMTCSNVLHITHYMGILWDWSKFIFLFTEFANDFEGMPFLLPARLPWAFLVSCLTLTLLNWLTFLLWGYCEYFPSQNAPDDPQQTCHPERQYKYWVKFIFCFANCTAN